MQGHGGGRLKPVAFCSRMLITAEQRHAQIENECIANMTDSSVVYMSLNYSQTTCASCAADQCQNPRQNTVNRRGAIPQKVLYFRSLNSPPTRAHNIYHLKS